MLAEHKIQRREFMNLIHHHLRKCYAGTQRALVSASQHVDSELQTGESAACCVIMCNVGNALADSGGPFFLEGGPILAGQQCPFFKIDYHGGIPLSHGLYV